MRLITYSDFSSFPEYAQNGINRERHLAVCQFLQSNGLLETVTSMEDRKTHEAVLESIHEREYIAAAKEHFVYQIAVRFLQLLEYGVDALKGNESIFCIGYPGGHHAEKNWKPLEGFCFFSNAAFAAELMRAKFGRILIIDFDIHQGNGTKDVIQGKNDIFLISSHSNGLYPLFAKEDLEQPNYLAVTIDPDESQQQNIMIEAIENVVSVFKPTAIVVSAGFDAHKDDPFSCLSFTDDSYRELGHAIAKLRLPTLAILEGGYNLDSIGLLVATFSRGFV